MTCDQVRPLLETFTARELGWGTAWRVRRHLAACPACASELAATRRLDKRIRLWRDVPAPVGLQSRIAAVGGEGGRPLVSKKGGDKRTQ